MRSDAIKLSFLGAAETVTGSRYLIESASSRILVDCGLFQGWKKLRERNWAAFPVEPASLDAIVLTHAHIDHSGYLPRLRNLGFEGPVYCTRGTRDLLQILLPDAGYLQEEAARHANRYGYSKHTPALPLYTREDAERSLSSLSPVAFYETFEAAPGITARFGRAGHIVGSAFVELRVGERSIAFSGDVGRPQDPIMKPPDALSRADYLVLESTYGDRRHSGEDIEQALAQAINTTFERGGVTIVPSFAVGRTQHLLHLLARLRAQGRIEPMPIFLDSPMAISATELFHAHVSEHRLSSADAEAMSNIAEYSHTADDSKAIDRRSGPMIIISASGMATGGRILHHLRRFLPDKRNTVLFVGYQAAGTRGRSLVDGADEIKLLGVYVPVQAQVVQLPGLSAHADYRELLAWLRPIEPAPQRVFVTHGEPAAADAMRRQLRDVLGWEAVVPDDGSTWLLP